MAATYMTATTGAAPTMAHSSSRGRCVETGVSTAKLMESSESCREKAAVRCLGATISAEALYSRVSCCVQGASKPPGGGGTLRQCNAKESNDGGKRAQQRVPEATDKALDQANKPSCRETAQEEGHEQARFPPNRVAEAPHEGCDHKGQDCTGYASIGPKPCCLPRCLAGQCSGTTWVSEAGSAQGDRCVHRGMLVAGSVWHS